MSNDQQAVRRYKPSVELADDGPVATMWEASMADINSEYPDYVLASEWDKLAARLAEAEGREKRLRGELKRISNVFDESWRKGSLERSIGDRARAALSTEEKP